MNARRSQGRDMEDGIGGLADGESVDRERARTSGNAHVIIRAMR